MVFNVIYMGGNKMTPKTFIFIIMYVSARGCDIQRRISDSAGAQVRSGCRAPLISAETQLVFSGRVESTFSVCF